MLKKILYLCLLMLFSACESSHETDNDRDLINEKKVEEEYEEVKQELEEAVSKLDSTGEEIEKNLEELGKKIDEEL